MKITTICATVMSATVCALTSSTLAGGGALAWGYNFFGQTNVPNTAYSNVTAITGGYRHTIAIKNSGVLAWGSNDWGQTSVPNAALSGVTKYRGRHVPLSRSYRWFTCCLGLQPQWSMHLSYFNSKL